MKLQGAIFDCPATLLDSAGIPLPGVDRFLALMKMDDVWMYLVTESDRQTTMDALARAGLSNYFRGILSAPEHKLTITSPELYVKAVKRLRTSPRATLVFTTQERIVRALSPEGIQVVLVGENHSEETLRLATEYITDYRAMSQLFY